MKRQSFESALIRFISGYKKANKLIEKERILKLKQLSIADSLCEYKDLCKIGETLGKNNDIKKLEKHRILFLIKRRRILNKLGLMYKIIK